MRDKLKYTGLIIVLSGMILTAMICTGSVTVHADMASDYIYSNMYKVLTADDLRTAAAYKSQKLENQESKNNGTGTPETETSTEPETTQPVTPTEPETPEPETPSEPETTEPEPEPEPVPPKSGLTQENGKLYYYLEGEKLFTGGYREVDVSGTKKYYFFQEDGSAFCGGYKPFTKDGKRVYYYFQEDGSAFCGGYKTFEQGGKRYYFFFNADGSAFTGGYKELTIDGKVCYFYFLANGQGFNTGYKTADIDGKKCYFYFGSDGRAVTNQTKEIKLGNRQSYFLFTDNGRAFTDGFKEVSESSGKSYYYYLKNGQAFTGGYKTVGSDYYYFNSNGKAFTGGVKEIPFGNAKCYYYFQSDGKALKSAWKDNIYYQSNGRQARSVFQNIDGKKYYFSADGTVKKSGWFGVGDGYYYAGSDGALAVSKVVEGYKLDASGKSKTKYRIVQIVNQHTKSNMTTQEKIKALYDWLVGNNWTYIRDTRHLKTGWTWYDGWIDDFTCEILDNSGGNCFRYACVFGFMVREATGLNVRVYYGDVPTWSGGTMVHGWITVYQDGDWYAYDPELMKFETMTNPSLCYKTLYSVTSTMIHLHGVGTNIY